MKSFETGRTYNEKQVIEYKQVENKGGELFKDLVFNCKDKSRHMSFQVEVMIFDVNDQKEIEYSILEAYDNGNYKNI